MGNESGEWIMHGINWDNPDCIHSVDEAIKYINEFGFLPLFKNEIDGFHLKKELFQSTGGVIIRRLIHGCGGLL